MNVSLDMTISLLIVLVFSKLLNDARLKWETCSIFEYKYDEVKKTCVFRRKHEQMNFKNDVVKKNLSRPVQFVKELLYVHVKADFQPSHKPARSLLQELANSLGVF